MSENPIAHRTNVGTTYEEVPPFWPEPPRPPANSPDVIVIVLDDVGFGSLGCYGSEIATPAMDALASSGLSYTNFHVTRCAPLPGLHYSPDAITTLSGCRCSPMLTVAIRVNAARSPTVPRWFRKCCGATDSTRPPSASGI